MFGSLSATRHKLCTINILLTPSTEGFGFRFMALMVGIDAATKANSNLVLSNNFWAQNKKTGGVRGNGFGPYEWAWDMLPFPSENEISGCKAHVNLFGSSSCNGKWCAHNNEGVYFHGIKSLRQLYGTALCNASSNYLHDKYNVQIVWHLRSGDNQVNMTRDVYERLATHLSNGFPNRGVRHVYITSNRIQLRKMFPWLEDELGFVYKHTTDDEHALHVMKDANVLVSTGSSFPLAAATLAAACKSGKQLHVSFPPKELGSHTNSLLSHKSRLKLATLAAKITSKDIRASGWFLTQFIGINSVPVDLTGRPLSIMYYNKMKKMMTQIDTNGLVDSEIADLTFEGWRN